MPLNSRRSVVGVDLGHARIKVAMVERTATGFRVARSGIAATPPDLIRDGLVLDPEQVGDALKALLRESHIHANTGIVAAAGGSVFVRQVGYPKMAATMLRDSLKYEAGRHVPGSVEDSYVEAEILGSNDETSMQVLLVAAPKDLVQSRIAVCRRAGLMVDEVDVEAFATYRATAEADPHRDLSEKTVAFFDLGASQTSVSIVCDGAFTMHRTLNGGGRALTEALMANFGLEEGDAEEGKSQLDLAMLLEKKDVDPPLKTLQPILDDLMRELKRSLNFYQSQGAGESAEGAKVDAVFL
ncbi:MAG: hypothetical protein C4320_07860, partial [Armatimonadota bacterium]